MIAQATPPKIAMAPNAILCLVPMGERSIIATAGKSASVWM